MAAKQSKKVSWFDRIRMLVARIAPAAFIVGLAVFMKSGGEAQDGSSASTGEETSLQITHPEIGAACRQKPFMTG